MNEFLEQVFDEQGVSREHRRAIANYLNILRARDFETYQHSVRVAVIATRIASECGIEGISPKALLWAGLLHDIGKALVDPDLLKKKTAFTEEDYREMEPHAVYGWRFLQNIHDYTANIIVRHHQFGSRPYPAQLPPLPAYLVSRESVIEASARLLALADYYDALVMRNNEKFGMNLTPAEKRQRYLEDNADQEDLILRLEQRGVLKFSR